MKFCSLSLLAAAGLAAASPIRIVVVSNQLARQQPDFLANIRVGHAAAAANANLVPKGLSTEAAEEPIFIPFAEAANSRIHCSGGEGFNSAAIHIANIFRQTLGLPLIEEHRRPHGEIMPVVEPSIPGEVHIMPFVEPPRPTSEELQAVPFGATVPSNADPQDPTWTRPTFANGRPMHAHRPHFRHGRYRSFVFRLNRAFMALGPWESYAVGFVFGCGLGSLARMIYVLVVVFSRTLSRRSAQRGGVHLAEDRQEQNVVVAPVQYVDEKSQPPTYVASTN